MNDPEIHLRTVVMILKIILTITHQLAPANQTFLDLYEICRSLLNVDFSLEPISVADVSFELVSQVELKKSCTSFM